MTKLFAVEYLQDCDLIGTRTVDHFSLEKRNTWCTTSPDPLDIRSISQEPPNADTHRLSRPVSAVGILHGNFFDLSSLQSHGLGISSTFFRRSHSISSDSSSATSLLTDDTTITTIMTPSKEKQPLALSTAVMAPHDRLALLTDWRAALEEVRVLCLKRHWKVCITRCETLLEESHGSVSRCCRASMPSTDIRNSLILCTNAIYISSTLFQMSYLLGRCLISRL